MFRFELFKWGFTFWIWWQRICIGFQYCPKWERPQLRITNNNGRRSNECLDINLAIWRCTFNFTLWQIGKFETLLRFWPDDRRPWRRGWKEYQ